MNPRSQIQNLIHREEAWLRLAAVAGADLVDQLKPEVERRRQFMAEHWARTSRRQFKPDLEIAAVESVYQDVARGAL